MSQSMDEIEKPKEPHVEESYLADVILGGQDGLVNVLGVILGVAAASGEPRIIIAAGLAATFAESVSMGAVAFTSMRARADFYAAELGREKREMEEVPEIEREEIREIYRKKGFRGKLLEEIVAKITSDKKVWLDTMMKEELGLEPVDMRQVLRSSIVVFVSAMIGSFIPLLPFFFVEVKSAILFSLVISAASLFLMGAYKAKMTVGKPVRSGLELLIIGMLAAAIGYIVGILFKAPTVP